MDISLYKDTLRDEEIPELMKLGVFSHESFFKTYESGYSVITLYLYRNYIIAHELAEFKIDLLLSITKYPPAILTHIFEFILPKKMKINYAQFIRLHRREQPGYVERLIFGFGHIQ